MMENRQIGARSFFPSARLSHCMLPLGKVLLLQARRRRYRDGLRLLFFPGQTGSLSIKEFFELLSHIFDDMKTVRPLPCCIGVTAGTVSAHDLNLRMLLKPYFDGFRSPERRAARWPDGALNRPTWSHISGRGATTNHPPQRRVPSQLQ